MRALSFVCLLLICTGMAEAYGARAYSTSPKGSDRGYVALNYTTPEKASEEALSGCSALGHGGCFIIQTFSNTCLGSAFNTTTGQEFWSTAPNTDQALNRAMGNCRAGLSPDNCHTKFFDCDTYSPPPPAPVVAQPVAASQPRRQQWEPLHEQMMYAAIAAGALLLGFVALPRITRAFRPVTVFSMDNHDPFPPESSPPPIPTSTPSAATPSPPPIPSATPPAPSREAAPQPPAPLAENVPLVRLELTRTQSRGQFTLHAKAYVNERYMALLRKYNLGAQVLYTSDERQRQLEIAARTGQGVGLMRGLVAGARAALGLKVTVASILAGQTISRKELSEMMDAEAAIISGCENLKAYILIAETFDGRQQVIEI